MGMFLPFCNSLWWFWNTLLPLFTILFGRNSFWTFDRLDTFKFVWLLLGLSRLFIALLDMSGYCELCIVCSAFTSRVSRSYYSYCLRSSKLWIILLCWSYTKLLYSGLPCMNSLPLSLFWSFSILFPLCWSFCRLNLSFLCSWWRESWLAFYSSFPKFWRFWLYKLSFRCIYLDWPVESIPFRSCISCCGLRTLPPRDRAWLWFWESCNAWSEAGGYRDGYSCDIGAD